jgi:pimeloyl-ACP methyl ester carboxylesterase
VADPVSTPLAGAARLSARWRPAETTTTWPAPLVVAIHGGAYTSAYFDVPGHSLLERARSLAIGALAIDRPGYGDSPALPAGEATQQRNAEILDEAIGAFWADHGAGPGIVLVGHSIGAAIALRIAAGTPAWPLLGVAVSGVGLRPMPGDAEKWSAFPDQPFVEMPAPLKAHKVFGPPGTFAQDAPERCRVADAPAPREELVEIVTGWPDVAREVLAGVEVPVHYRQADGDNLWTVDQGEVAAFAAALSAAPFVDARLIARCGHNIDLHHAGAAFQSEQLAFALRCAVEA